MTMNSRDLLLSTKKEIREANIQEVDPRIKQDPNIAVLDVREKDEWDEGHLPGATHLPRGFLEVRVEKAIEDRNKPIVVYCAGGTRSAFAAKTLQDMGYTNVVSMAG